MNTDEMTKFLLDYYCDMCDYCTLDHESCKGHCREGLAEWLEQEHKEHLKSCPFCGSDNLEVIKVIDANMFDGDGYVECYRVKCLNCGAKTGRTETEQEARELWNERFEEC